MPPSKSPDLSADTLEQTLLSLIERTAWDIPADVDKAILQATKVEEAGTNGHAALEEIGQAIDHARESKTILGSDPVALHFTVDGPATLDRPAIEAAARAAAHTAATEGWIRTQIIDLPSGKPRRGKDLGVIPTVRFRVVDGPIQVHLWMRGPGEAGIASIAQIPSPIAPGEPTIEKAGRVAVHAIHETQGRSGGPGIVGIHVGADPIEGFAHAADQILRPIGSKNPQRALTKVEEKIAQDANQLGVGPQGLGGRTTVLCAHLSVSEVPKDRWTVSVVMSGWACRRQTVTLGKGGSIDSWDCAMAETAYRTPREPEPIEEPEPPKKKRAKKKTAAAPAAEAETDAKSPAKKTPAKTATSKKTAAKKPAAKKTAAVKKTTSKSTKTSKKS